MHATNVIRVSVLAAGVAIAVAAAPAAAAAPSVPSCASTTLSTVCQSPGNAQVVSTPPVVGYQQQFPYDGGFGFAPFAVGGLPW